MTRLSLHDVCVNIPIYNADTRSLKNTLFKRAVGGALRQARGNRHFVRALDNVSLSFHTGDRVALIGHNGAGKSTLLRVMGEIYEPVTGHVERTGSLAPIFDVALGFDMESTGRDNIMLRGMYLGHSAARMHAQFEEIAEFTELGEYLAMPLRTYSAGMLMRLAFAVSTAITPDILLMDEWFGVGDAEFIQKAEKRIDSMLAHAGIVILATHDAALARRVCSKAAWLEGGRVRAFGPIDDILFAYEAASAA